MEELEFTEAEANMADLIGEYEQYESATTAEETVTEADDAETAAAEGEDDQDLDAEP